MMSVFKEFVKYHSLGNDFVVVDWFKRPESYLQSMLHQENWASIVKSICDRHTGVGADGILIIKSNHEAHMPEMLVFNADGSQAENCLNGLRCIADFLHQKKQFPEKFSIKIGPRMVHVAISHPQGQSSHVDIISNVGKATVSGQLTIEVGARAFTGSVANIGNPHFIIHEAITRDQLETIGGDIMRHKAFPAQTNVEFVIPHVHDRTRYDLLVYERGVGITNACSSGAAAVVRDLIGRGLVARGQKITLTMLGGPLQAWVDHEDNIYLQAHACLVFEGTLGNTLLGYEA